MTHQEQYGATPNDWSILADVAGLTADLLPVVSNPGLRISEESNLKTLGKVPSLINAQGFVVGIGGWTKKTSTSRDIDRWQQNADLGICVQTRVVRALDVDIDDAGVVERIVEIASRHLGALPERGRGDSAKCLLAFTLPGEFTKRILKTAHGAIEFLATGQQFIAAGTHPKGSRYVWSGGMPYDFPVVTAEAFEACWAELMHQFAVEEVVVYGAGAQLKEVRRQVEVEDEFADYLHVNGWVLGETRDGRLNITCPFEHEHSGPSADDTATQYMPKGVGGFDRGHTVCLHAHCANRNEADFIEAVGFGVAQFDIVEAPEGEAEDPAEMPMFLRNPESGKILTNLRNAMMGLRAPAWCGVDIAHDTFRDELMLTQAGKTSWRAFRDADYARLRLQLEGKGLALGVELLKEAVGLRADENRFDSAQLWLREEVPAWDGVTRIASFYPRLFGTMNSAYTRAVGLYTWTAMAGRVLDPGCKVDMVPILRGTQGQQKSAAIEAMVPSHEFFVELDLSDRDDDMSRLMRGKLIAELAELKGLHNRDIEAVKAFITRRHEQWIPKYREFATTFPRRLLFMGTTNQNEFLADDTGNRRWLPMEVSRVDLDALKDERLQLWAEARETYRRTGIQWQEAERLAGAEHEQFRIQDGWESTVRDWLEEFDDLDDATRGGPRSDHPIRIEDVLVGALRMEPKAIKAADLSRMGRVLTALGYEKKDRRVEGKVRKVWLLKFANPHETADLV